MCALVKCHVSEARGQTFIKQREKLLYTNISKNLTDEPRRGATSTGWGEKTKPKNNHIKNI